MKTFEAAHQHDHLFASLDYTPIYYICYSTVSKSTHLQFSLQQITQNTATLPLLSIRENPVIFLLQQDWFSLQFLQ